MLKYYFLLGNIPDTAIRGTCPNSLILLSFALIFFTLCIAVYLTSYLSKERYPRWDTLIQWVAATVMGLGVWGANIVGILPYTLKTSLYYEPLLASFSMLMAIVFAYFVLDSIKSKKGGVTLRSSGLNAVLLGLGIIVMYHAGIAAIEANESAQYLPSLFGLSMVLAIIASYGMLYGMHMLVENKGRYSLLRKVVIMFLMAGMLCAVNCVNFLSTVFLPREEIYYDIESYYTVFVLSIVGIGFLMLVAVLYWGTKIKGRELVEDAVEGRRYPLPVLFSFIVGTVITFLAFFAVRNFQEAELKQIFKIKSKNLTHVIERALSEYVRVLDSLGAFYNASQLIEQEEFSSFVNNTLSAMPEILTIGFVKQIPREQVTAFLEETGKEMAGYTYKVFDEKEKSFVPVFPSVTHPFCYLVYYSTPLAVSKDMMGFDITTDQRMYYALQRSGYRKEVIASEPMPSFFEKEAITDDVYMFSPIVKKEVSYLGEEGQWQDTVKGFFIVGFDIKDFLLRLQNKKEFQEVDVSLYDISKEVYIPLFTSSKNKDLATGYHEDINFSGKTWRAYYWPRQQFFERSLWQEMVTLVMGMMVTILITAYIYQLILRQRKEIEAKAILANEIKEKEKLNVKMKEYTKELEKTRQEMTKINKELVEEERRLHAIMDNAMEGIITLDHSGKVQSFNRGAETIFSLKSKEIIGKDIALLIPELYKVPDEKQQGYFEGGANWIIGKKRELTGLRKKRVNFPLSVSVSEVIIDNAPIYIVMLHDISEQKAKEAELLKEKERAEAANTAKSDFLANMSHEIRTPMNGVMGMAGLLLDTKLTDEQRSWSQIIKKSGENLLKIINDILDYSKIEAGKLDLRNTSMDIQGILEETTNVLRMMAQEKGIEIIVAIAPETPKYMVGDPVRIRQVIFNLVGNAVKFTEKGHVLIRLETKSEQKKKIRLFFSVEDTGIGIPESKQEYIFKKFAQEQESMKRKYGGTGLGLAICKSLIEMMQGSIHVRSEVGKGSVFSFDILLEKDTGEKEPQDILLKTDLSAMRVLVLDDYEPSKEVMMTQVMRLGVEVEAFSSPEKFIKKIKSSKNPYDLLIIDFYLGEKNALGLIKEIRQCNATNTSTVLLVSAIDHAISQEDMQSAGIAGILMKPFYPDTLFAVLNVVCRKRQQGAAIPFLTNHYLQKLTQVKVQQEKPGHKKFPGVNVLVVEDMKVNQMLINKILERHACHVEIAETGKEAVDAVKKHIFDVIFMDCHMPEMDGFEATQLIRSFENDNHKKPTAIIALTADAMAGDREKCIKIGMDDYLNKPLMAEQVEEMLVKWVPEKQQV